MRQEQTVIVVDAVWEGMLWLVLEVSTFHRHNDLRQAAPTGRQAFVGIGPVGHYSGRMALDNGLASLAVGAEDS